MSAPPDPRVDRRYTDAGVERRRQLLDIAAGLFAERGYGPTRIADICAAAGVAKGLFYWYFPSKEALFADLVRTMRHELRRAQGAAMNPADDPLVRLGHGTAASMRFMAEHRAYFALLDLERTEPALDDVLREGAEVYVADIERILREGQRLGQVVPEEPRLLAIGVLGAVSSFGRARRDGRLAGVDDEQLATSVAAWVVRAVSDPRSNPKPAGGR